MNCPSCGQKGKTVKPVTLESLLRPEANERLTDSTYRFCAADDCEIVYFGEDGTTFDKADLTVRVGCKETDAPRQVCYCFDYTVEDIEAQVAETGTSTIPEAITAECRAGRDRCEETNPKGSCCLGDVRAAMKRAQVGALVTDDEPADCCAVPERETSKESRAGLWASGGAVVAAVLSSACCWLPLLLIAFGASAAGVSGFFEEYRVHFLVVTALLLGTGFYLIYFRKEQCGPDGSCAVPNPRLMRVNRVMLWVATVFVLAFVLFPNYVGSLMGSDTPSEQAPASTSAVEVTLDIGGMTCEGCATVLRTALLEVPGVSSANISYEKKQAIVVAEPTVTDRAIRQAVEGAGYELQSLSR